MHSGSVSRSYSIYVPILSPDLFSPANELVYLDSSTYISTQSAGSYVKVKCIIYCGLSRVLSTKSICMSVGKELILISFKMKIVL